MIGDYVEDVHRKYIIRANLTHVYLLEHAWSVPGNTWDGWQVPHWRFHLHPKRWLPWQRSLPEARACAERWIAARKTKIEAFLAAQEAIASQMADAEEVDNLLENL